MGAKGQWSLRRLVLLAGLALVVASGFLPALEVVTALSQSAHAQDVGDGSTADDAVRRLLLAAPPVPRDIFEIRQRLAAHGGKLRAHLVVNGGHNNPARTTAHQIKFMAFETYTNSTPGKTLEEDELFLGFFLGEDNKALVVLPGFVEIIAWDRTKQVYNFWELIGPEWHYRGDSNDVLTNVQRINLADASPTFTFVRHSPTDRAPVLRCSGCHTLGGPIMKELEAPHNDWWTQARLLNLGPYKLQAGSNATNPAHVAARLFDGTHEATDAANLSAQVKNGMDRLLAARANHGAGGQSVKQQLRSLFTTMEINLVSDRVPLTERERQNGAVEIPPDFFVDSRLVGNREAIPVPLVLYREALTQVEARFAPGETPGLVETHHAFLVPARSYGDNRMIETLLQQGLLDEELVADVLAVDFTTPVFSPARASLLRFVPDTATDAAELRDQLLRALKTAPPDDHAAQELLANLTEPTRTAAAHRQAATAYLAACGQAATSREAIVDWLRVAAQRRHELATAETARHPQGGITEPGFRVIFPVSAHAPEAGEFRLDPTTSRAVRRTP
jgi:hypothetical protein